MATAHATQPLAEASMDVSSGRPVVTIATSQGASLKLLVDSGGFGGIALIPAALSSAAVEFSGRTVEWQDAQGHRFSSRQFTESDLRIGEKQIGPIGGSELLGSSKELPHDTVGYLGIDILDKFIVKMDYKSGVLSLYQASGRSAFADVCGTSSFPATLRNGVVEVRARTDDSELLLQLDTGSSLTFIHPDVAEAKAPADNARQQTVRRFSHFALGGHDFGRQVLDLKLFNAPAVDGVLGSDFFVGRTLCLDLAHQQASLD